MQKSFHLLSRRRQLFHSFINRNLTHH